MVLWTIVPPEAIFASSAEVPEQEEVRIGDRTVLVEKLSPARSRVVRILSTDPYDYLEPGLQPGTLLEWRPFAE